MLRDRKIQFHDGNNKDPDWKLKQAVLIVVKGCLVVGLGVEQCWASGLLDSLLQILANTWTSTSFGAW